MSCEEDPFHDEYESLPTSNVTVHLMAGAAAGIAEHCIMYPVDSIKTRMQSMNPTKSVHYKNIMTAFREMIRTEGMLRPVRGINAVALGAAPAHAMYFSCYEKMKRNLVENVFGARFISYALAGSCATLLHDAVMNPAEVVKQRMQMFDSPYRSCRHCFMSVLKHEGPRAFYRSYLTQLTMNIPFQSIHFVIYELSQEGLNPKREYAPLSHMISGASAGAVAAAATTPLDVCKTLLNTQEKCAMARFHSIEGMSQAATAIYKYQGFLGFFAGLRARVIYQMPSTAIAWSVYEFFKFYISRNRNAAVDAAVTFGNEQAQQAGGMVSPLLAAAVSSTNTLSSYQPLSSTSYNRQFNIQDDSRQSRHGGES